MKKKVLLHVCCAPCAGYVIQQLEKPKKEPDSEASESGSFLDFSVTPFFYNPNIHPKQEYEKRLDELKKYFRHPPEGDPDDRRGRLQVGDYESENWFAATQGLEHEPEKGLRCAVCFRLRLEKTAQVAREHNFNYFASTLTISPHKPAGTINQIGLELAEKYGINFLPADWKKHNGFKKSCQLAKEHNFYRQDYCGCVYSQSDRQV